MGIVVVSWLLYLKTVKDDFTIISEPTGIPMGTREACLQLTAADDSIAEQDEVFIVMIQPINPSDQVNGTTAIIITDNDGKLTNLGMYLRVRLSFIKTPVCRGKKWTLPFQQSHK